MKNKNLTLRWVAIFFIFPSFMRGLSLSARAFFNSDTVSAVYLGIDFTLAKLINDDASDATIIQSQQFNGINDLNIGLQRSKMQSTTWRIKTSINGRQRLNKYPF